jgi:hypothetical protein
MWDTRVHDALACGSVGAGQSVVLVQQLEHPNSNRPMFHSDLVKYFEAAAAEELLNCLDFRIGCEACSHLSDSRISAKGNSILWSSRATASGRRAKERSDNKRNPQIRSRRPLREGPPPKYAFRVPYIADQPGSPWTSRTGSPPRRLGILLACCDAAPRPPCLEWVSGEAHPSEFLQE